MMVILVDVLAILGCGLEGLVSGFLVTAGGEMFGEADMSDDGAFQLSTSRKKIIQ